MYCSKTDLENYLNTTITISGGDVTAQVNSWISSVSKWIDNYTDRSFEEVNAVRKYDGNGKDHLDIDDLLSVDKIWFVSNDSTGDAQTYELATTDYYLYHNSNPNKTPYNLIKLNPNGDYRTFPAWALQNIWIKGDWGYSVTAPDDIKMVAVKLVAAIARLGKDGGDIKAFSEGDLSITYNDFEKTINSDLSVKSILDFYKRKPQLIGFKAIRI